MLWVAVGIGIVFIVLVIVLFWKEGRAIDKAYLEVEKEMGDVASMDFKDAKRRAYRFIEKNGDTEPWDRPMDEQAESTLHQFDQAVQAFLRKWKRVRFLQTGTEISATLLCLDAQRKDIWIIGQNVSDEYLLGIVPGKPKLYELNNGYIREEYPSIFHYILLAEDIK